MADGEVGEVLVDVEGVSKRYCRDLRSSLVHGVRDIAGELLGTGVPDRRQLRPGEFWALDDVSFQLRRGECLGLIGPNGAGKSTLLKLISGLIKPDAGRIRVRGRVGALIELGAGFHPLLTGRENIRVNASILGLDRRQLADRQDAIIDFADIGDAIDAPVQSYSSGMRARLGFAIAAHLDPDVLLIDEVLAVGDVGFRMKCFARMRAMRSNGVAMALVSHSHADFVRVASRGLTLKQGRIVFSGDVDRAVAAYEIAASQTGDDPGFPRGKASLVSVNIADATSGTATLRSGSACVVRIVIRARTQIPDARVVLNLESPRCGLLASVSSATGHGPLQLSPGEHEICVRIACLPFLAGGYRLAVSLYGRSITDFLDIRRCAAVFEVTGDTLDSLGFGTFGSVALPCEWRATALHDLATTPDLWPAG